MEIVSFAPIEQSDAHILILGTMPGEASLRMNQYYAHPRNVFWKIMFTMFDSPFSDIYTERIELLVHNRIALWDVLQSCKRAGSADSAIKDELPNPLDTFLYTHRHIHTILLNGSSAAYYFRKHFKSLESYSVITVPSTSPAHARLSFEKKLEVWRESINPALMKTQYHA